MVAAKSGKAMIIPTRGWFTRIKREYAVNAFEMVKALSLPDAIPAKVLKVRIGDQIGVQITSYRLLATVILTVK